MKKHAAVLLCLVFCILYFISGCTTTGPSDRRARRGDQIKVAIDAVPDDRDFCSTVDYSGNIWVPYVGNVQVIGQTCREIVITLREEYGHDLGPDPKIHVTFAQ